MSAARAWCWVAGLSALALLQPGLAAAGKVAPAEQLRELNAEREKAEFLLHQVDTKQSAILAVLDGLDHEVRSALDDANAAHKKAAAAAMKLKTARDVEAAVERERVSVAKELGPRLLLRYRLRGASYLQALLSTTSLGDLLWRRKMIDRILRNDLDLVDHLATVQKAATDARTVVEAQKAELADAEKAARDRSDEVKSRRSVQAQVLAGLQKEKGTYVRTLSEVEKSRQQLVNTIAALPPPPEGLGGFGNERGHLEWPAAGTVEVNYGRQVDPKFKTVWWQKGYDIRASAGTAIKAPYQAIVAYAGWFSGFGNLVILDHGEGYYTLYAHLQELRVDKGNRVGDGDTLGLVGDTGSLKGPYLYFEIRSGSKALDPGEWLAKH